MGPLCIKMKIRKIFVPFQTIKKITHLKNILNNPLNKVKN